MIFRFQKTSATSTKVENATLPKPTNVTGSMKNLAQYVYTAANPCQTNTDQPIETWPVVFLLDNAREELDLRGRIL